MMKKLQKVIRVRMNISKMSHMKDEQGLNELEKIEKRFEKIVSNLSTV